MTTASDPNESRNIQPARRTLDHLLSEHTEVEGAVTDTSITVDTKASKTAPLNYVEIFAGCGGMCHGLKTSGLNCVAALEWWGPAVETLRKNHSFPVVHGDVTLQTTKDELYRVVGEENVQIVVGGFPCQGFSMAGRRDVADPRNRLYVELLEIVSVMRPEFVVMENVKGLMSMCKGKVVELIRNDFYKIGYKLDVRVLCAADYGVPQARERVILVGNRLGLDNPYPQALLDPGAHRTVKEAIEDLVPKAEDRPFSHIFSRHEPSMQKRLAAIPQGKSLYDNYSDAWRKPFWDKPSPTVKENHGGVFVHPLLPRVMTPRELARLQSFPDSYLFAGNKSHILKQIGNAVPPLLAEAIGRAVQSVYPQTP